MKNILSKKNLKVAFGAIILGSALLPLLIVSTLAQRFFYHQMIEQQERSLLGATQIIEKNLPAEITQEWCVKVVDQLPFRITVVRIKDLMRICDSLTVTKIGKQVENARKYEELTEAIKKGHSVIFRESENLQEPVVYAVTLSHDGQHIVRLGFSLREAEKKLKSFDHAILLCAGIFVLLAVLFNGIYFKMISLGLKKLLQTIDQKHIHFLDQASHELRTPIASLLSSVATLREPDLNPTDQKKFLEIVFRNATRLDLLTKDFLTLSSLEIGGRALTPLENLSPKELTEQTLATLAPLIRERNLNVELRVNTDKLWGHAFSIDQVLTNYLSNAIKFSPAHTKIQIHWKDWEQGTLLCVEDEGPGILASDLPHVFERFFRARTQSASTQTAPGTGLGLAIVAEILKQHEGKSWSENRSEASSGARFYAWFPLP